MQTIITDPKIKSVFSDFVNMVTDSGLLNTSRQFNDAINDFTQYTSQPVFKFDICYFEQSGGSFFDNAFEWIIGSKISFQNSLISKTIEIDNSTLNFTIYLFENECNRKVGDIPPTIFFLLLSKTDLFNNELHDKLQALSTQYPYIIVISEEQLIIPETIKKEIVNNLLNFEQFDIANLPSKKFFEKICDNEYFKLLNGILDNNCLISIDSLSNIFELLLVQEERNLKGKKTAVHQQIINLQAKGNFSSSDISSNLRNELTNQITMVEKGITDNFENYLRPQTGQLSKIVEDLVINMPVLEEVEKSRTTSLVIPNDFEKQFLNIVYESLLKAGHEHLIVIRDSFRATQAEIEKKIENYNIPQIPFNFRPMTDQQLSNILNSVVRFDKPYEGILAKQGIVEYLTALRKYQSIFLMFISSFGLYFVNIKSIAYIMIPITIILLGICIFFIYHTVQNEHKEGHEREYEKAKESLRNETKRIAVEIHKQWLKILSDHLRQQLSHNINILDNSLKNFGSKQVNDKDEENKRVQRQNMVLENTEKKLGNITKIRETFLRNFERVKSEIKQSFLNNLKLNG